MDNDHHVACVDKDDNVEMWTYTECDMNSTEEVKETRGLVKTHAGVMVARSF